MMRRLDTGRWEDTEPARLNELATLMNVEGTVSRFIPFDPHENVKNNRNLASELTMTSNSWFGDQARPIDAPLLAIVDGLMNACPSP